MAFDQSTRNKLQRFVADVRSLLTAEFTRQMQNEYGMDPVTGSVSPIETLHLDDSKLDTARILRDTLDHYRKGSTASDDKQLIEQITREQAFTVLNRFAALKMAEARGILIQSLDRGYESQGFQLYQNVAGAGLGETGDAYKSYLFSIFDELAVDLKVLFDRFSPTGLLFPKETVMLELLALVNDREIEPLWSEDETIGWIYQYFNTKEERKKMRDESAAPRNSRELAVRNQFFTARYVVEFLIDNTLGRTWYEMTRGKTALRESCRFLVRRPKEIFLADLEKAAKHFGTDLEESGIPDSVRAAFQGDFVGAFEEQSGSNRWWIGLAIPPDQYETVTGIPAKELDDYPHLGDVWDALDGTNSSKHLLETDSLLAAFSQFILTSSGGPYAIEPTERLWNAISESLVNKSGDDASQQELLERPVYIPFRPVKDPREILMLDPACGSMHFGLYAFDLFLKIYEEAWDLSVSPISTGGFKPLRETYDNDKERFLLDVPRLIIENNIHGVDIDPRAMQIAGLSLWLRAQRAWAEHNVKPHDRPQIRRSNIVCAEPMPGSVDLLEEFIAKHFADTPEKRLLGEFVRRIFDSMKLAGEAGSLLRIEEEVASLISESREQWLKLKGEKESFLFEGARVDVQQGFDFDVGGITDANFWNRAENEIYKALRRYSEASGAGEGYKRRLFADDASQGFAFIDLCRKRYDAVLMNPPFGETTTASNNYIEDNYRSYSKNILCAFLERLPMMLAQTGRCGSVIDRTILIKNSYEKFRKKHLLDNESLEIAIDLGWGVLDANVEVASLVIQKTSFDSKALGFDVSYTADKEVELRSQLDEPIEMTYDSLKEQPFAAINFQMPIYLRAALKQSPSIHDENLSFYNGHTIKSDVFKRLVWEVAPTELISKAKRMWNGSEYSPFAVSFQEVVIWDDFGGLGRHRSTIFRSPAKHLLPGLCFGKRGDYLDVQILPSGFILTNEGFGSPCGDNEETWFMLAYLNSLPAQSALNFYCGQHKGVGYVNALPLAGLNGASRSAAVLLAKKSYEILRSALRVSEVDSLFVSPFAINANGADSARTWINDFVDASRTLANNHAEIDELFLQIFKVESEEAATIVESAKNRPVVSILGLDYRDEAGLEAFYFASVLSYAVGTIFGRWDLSFVNNVKSVPVLPTPFASLPNCPPGMLQRADGLPASSEDVPTDYPIDIAWNGILVDDVGHSYDIEYRLRNVFQVIWESHAEAMESEACEALAVRTFRDYFQKPSAFFSDHLKRYSKSRRQAPIYLPLSTQFGEYSLWLYYHRLTDQTLFSCINDFVEPKIRQVKDDVNGLSSKQGRTSEDEKRLEQLTDLSFELEELRDELLRLAPIWKPNLNDGVQITMSPLWKLFRLPKWRKTLEDTWKKLEKGEYDWAHLAYSLYPDRVREKCKKDKSLAIAHNLEDLYEEPPSTKKMKAKKAANVENTLGLE